jgi:menaquinone-dependent protoporphyrinogen oxidase
MRVSEARVLIVHASRDGQATAIARRIGHVMTQQGHAASVVPVDDPSIAAELERSEAVVIGAGIRYGRHGRAVETLVRDHLGAIAARHNAFFSVSMSAARAGQGEAARYVEEFVQRTHWRPHRIATFAGALRYTRYNPFLRLVMRLISKSAGGDTDTSRDHEYTDWDAVERFAREIAAEPARLAT